MRGNIRRFALSSVVALAVVAGMAGPASADAGDLDPGFGGGDGQVSTTLGVSGAFGEAMLVQGNGKILVVGEANHSADDIAIGVVRYKPNGTLDPTWGNGGRVVTNLTGEFDSGYAIASAGNGRILVGGYAGTNFAAVRYLPDGHLDHSFSGDGKSIITFPGGSHSFAYDMAIAPGGKIVLVGQRDDAGGVSRYAVVRLTKDGAPDHTFSGDGRVTTDLGPNSFAYAVVVLADGSIVATGDAQTTEHTSPGMVKYLADGDLDEGFGDGGIFVRDVGADLSPADMVRLGTGKLLVAASYRTGAGTFDLGLARFRADGHADLTFGPNGVVTHNFGGENEYPERMARAGTKVLVAIGHGVDDAYRLGVARLQANGGVDVGFGDEGLALATVDHSFANAVGLQQDGKVVVAGSVGETDDDAKFMVARFLGS